MANDIFALASRKGRCPNSMVRNAESRLLKSLPLTSCVSRFISAMISSRCISVALSSFSVNACEEKPSLYVFSTASQTKAQSRMATIAWAGKKSSKGTFSSFDEASSGTISTVSRRSFESCVSTSKVRIESISSPKKSMRKGSSHENENTSSMLPRRANCPGS